MISSPDSNPPRTALIGCGRWGRNIARVLARLGALAVIADPHSSEAPAFGAELGVAVTGDVEAAFADGIEAVAIAAPAVDHAALAMRALKAGKPVFVEKPLALEVADAEAVAAQAERRGLPLMVGHLLQYHPAFAALKQQVRDGAIGPVRHVISNRLNPGAIRTEENALWSMAPHDFSMILALMGDEPEAVSALAARVVNPAVPDQYAVHLRFPRGRTAQVNVSWLSPYKEHKLTVLGAEGALVFEDTASDPERKLVIHRGYVDRSGAAPRFVKGVGEPVPFARQEPLEMEMRTFLALARGEGGCPTGPDEAIAVLRLLQRADAAAA